MRRLADRLQELSRGMIFRIADNGHANSQAIGDRFLRNSFGGVVRAFGVHCRPQDVDHSGYIQFIKHHDMIYRPKGGYKSHAFILRQNRPALALQGSDRNIAVNRDDECVAQLSRAFQIPYMTHVQYVETTIRKDDALSADQVFQVFKLR